MAWVGEAGKLRLFRAIHLTWTEHDARPGLADTSLSARAQTRMVLLAPRAREALLLHAIEDLDVGAIGSILGISAEEASALIVAAIDGMEDAVRGRMLVVEDEAVIAMDLAAIVRDMGHRVTGVARTRDEALSLAAEDPPDLVLADLHLADGSSGVEVVGEIGALRGDVPAIFVTAFPEQVRDVGPREPALLIPKPFSEEQVRLAVSQAMFFSSKETLAA